VFGVPKGISGIWKTAGSRKVRLHQDTLNLTLLLGVHHRAHRKGRESLPHPVVPRDLGKGDKSYAQVCDMFLRNRVQCLRNPKVALSATCLA
jgi:hypothetical protein